MHSLSKEPKNSTSVAGFKSAFCRERTKNVESDAAAPVLTALLGKTGGKTR
jgi:hypothetical protein